MVIYLHWNLDVFYLTLLTTAIRNVCISLHVSYFTAFIICAHVFQIEELLVQCEAYILQQQIGFPQQK